ncbi:MAG: hypothetical protein IJ071_01465 [Ruminococcus sp.]|nr:hypothetical protein [Ruminococcus sp.]
MAIDTNKLRRGEKVKCTCCNKGVLVPAYGSTPEKAGRFKCNECGEILHIKFKMDKLNRP